jgi:hypothetical protein
LNETDAPPRRRAAKRHCLTEKRTCPFRRKKSARAKLEIVNKTFLLGGER